MNELPDIPTEQLEQLAALDLGVIDNEVGVDLGLLAVEVITERGANLAVDVIVHDDLVFRARLGTTGPHNDEWLRGKAAVARHYELPSLLVRRQLESTGRTVADDGLDPETHRAHGGSIPLRAAGRVVGTITVSGEPDVVDHDVAAETIRRYVAQLGE